MNVSPRVVTSSLLPRVIGVDPVNGPRSIVKFNPTTNLATELVLVVYGMPGPQGSKSFKGLTPSGHARLVESSKKVKPWRQAIVDQVDSLVTPLGLRRPLFDGPLSVGFYFTLPKPGSAPKRRTTWPCRKPDGSKLQRSTEDALTDSGVWKDDARVVDWHGRKFFPGEGDMALPVPGAIVYVSRLDLAPELQL